MHFLLKNLKIYTFNIFIHILHVFLSVYDFIISSIMSVDNVTREVEKLKKEMDEKCQQSVQLYEQLKDSGYTSKKAPIIIITIPVCLELRRFIYEKKARYSKEEDVMITYNHLTGLKEESLILGLFGNALMCLSIQCDLITTEHGRIMHERSRELLEIIFNFAKIFFIMGCYEDTAKYCYIGTALSETINDRVDFRAIYEACLEKKQMGPLSKHKTEFSDLPNQMFLDWPYRVYYMNVYPDKDPKAVYLKRAKRLMELEEKIEEARCRFEQIMFNGDFPGLTMTCKDFCEKSFIKLGFDWTPVLTADLEELVGKKNSNKNKKKMDPNPTAAAKKLVEANDSTATSKRKKKKKSASTENSAKFSAAVAVNPQITSIEDEPSFNENDAGEVVDSRFTSGNKFECLLGGGGKGGNLHSRDKNRTAVPAKSASDKNESKKMAPPSGSRTNSVSASSNHAAKNINAKSSLVGGGSSRPSISTNQDDESYSYNEEYDKNVSAEDSDGKFEPTVSVAKKAFSPMPKLVRLEKLTVPGSAGGFDYLPKSNKEFRVENGLFLPDVVPKSTGSSSNTSSINRDKPANAHKSLNPWIPQAWNQNRGQPPMKSDVTNSLYEHVVENYAIKWACDSCVMKFRDKERVMACKIDHESPTNAQTCANNILLLRPKPVKARWFAQVRNAQLILTDRNFSGREFFVCNSLADDVDCSYADNCANPHSPEEQVIWNMISNMHGSFDDLFSTLKNPLSNNCSETSSLIRDKDALAVQLMSKRMMPPPADSNVYLGPRGGQRFRPLNGGGPNFGSDPNKYKPPLAQLSNTTRYGTAVDKRVFVPPSFGPPPPNFTSVQSRSPTNEVERSAPLVSSFGQQNEDEERISLLSKSSIWGSAPSDPNLMLAKPKEVAGPTFYCFLCDMKFSDEKRYDDHCKLPTHEQLNRVDSKRTWSCRPPCQSKPFSICKNHTNSASCLFSHPNLINFCPNAHSLAELAEWNERLDFLRKEMKRQVHDELNEIYSRINQAKAKSDVVSNSLDFAKVEITGSLTESLPLNRRNETISWLFAIDSDVSLHRVALIEKQSFYYFRLVSPFAPLTDGTLCYADAVSDNDLIRHYEVKVEFTGSQSSGTYTQEVIFDFGPTEKLLSIQLKVNVGLQEMTLNRIANLHNLLSIKDCWTPDNAEIIWISKERNFRPPTENDIVHNWQYQINESTVFAMMKKWISAEEMRRQVVLSKFRLRGEAKLSAILRNPDETDRSVYPYPQGALFAQLTLDHPINEDNNVTDLLTGYCEYAFVAVWDPQQQQQQQKTKPGVKKRVYEVQMVNKHRFGIDGIFQKKIYLCLSAVFVRHHNMKAGECRNLEVQFNIAHKTFVSWHRALDILAQKRYTHFVYPNLLHQCMVFTCGGIDAKFNAYQKQTIDMLNQQWTGEGKNLEQRQVLQHVVRCAFNKNHWIPPLVIFGPFGTGKTKTIADAVCTLLSNSFFSHTKILICAHSNSTADMYLKLISNSGLFRQETLVSIIWRIFSTRFNLDSIPPFIRPFVRMDGGRPEKLTLENFASLRVVITTMTKADTLIKLFVNSQEAFTFTHIFLDEASQALEVETIMPLCMAKPTTCVVVAGDPFQIKPMVYFTECSQLSSSYLERLYDYYSKQEQSVKSISPDCSIPKIFFNKVYRCHPDILNFISQTVYGNNMNLESCAQFPKQFIEPMHFAWAPGGEEILANGLSYRNELEVVEVIEQVKYFRANWPRDWGELDIGIAVAHYEQMRAIQDALRRENMPSGKVHVGKVIMFQGKEFKVLIISTVRGSNMLNNKEALQSRRLGFLDEPRLVNTALTRARYCVVVVGNPVALCSVGACKQMWRRYIQHCFDKGTFLPNNTSFARVKEMVQEAEVAIACALSN